MQCELPRQPTLRETDATRTLNYSNTYIRMAIFSMDLDKQKNFNNFVK